MTAKSSLLAALAFTFTACSPSEQATVPGVTSFCQACDASAAAAIDGGHFLVADDEDNILRLFSQQGGQPMAEFNFHAFLGAQKKSDEADLEGAALLDGVCFWIGSHGRNSKAKESPRRQLIFATRAEKKDGKWTVQPVGKPYANLLEDLLADPRLKRFGLEAASALAPKTAGALNIEGLAATTEGHLLIGFRNPIPGGKALLVPLLNPREVLDGARSKLGDPLELDLGGLGIRSLDYHEGRYLIVAGSYDETRKPRLFTWEGGATPVTAIEGVSFKGLNPEGLVYSAEQKQFMVLSDDGTVTINGKPCKDLKDANLKRFRGAWIQL